MSKPKSTKLTTVKAAADAFVKSHRFDGLAFHYTRTVSRYVKLLVKHYGPRELDELTPEDLLKSMSKDWHNTTKANYLRVIKTFCAWARDNNYLPHDRRTVAERTKVPRVIPAEPEFFTPEEMRRLLTVAGMLVGGEEEYLLSLLVLGGFVGMRQSEICRVDWRDINLLPTFQAVRLSPRVTKTGSRRIAIIPPNAVLWLNHISDKTGPVVPAGMMQNINRPIGKLAKEAGVTWKDNGLRHSYVTYAMAKERNAYMVAEQVGNSPQILQRHYKGLVLEPDADEWFGITPDSIL